VAIHNTINSKGHLTAIKRISSVQGQQGGKEAISAKSVLRHGQGRNKAVAG
jgi:hypothetical protein